MQPDWDKTEFRNLLQSVAKQRDTWNAFFNMDKLSKMRNSQKFAWSLTTDGVSVGVLFDKVVDNPNESEEPPTKRPKKSTKSRESKEQEVKKPMLTDLKKGNYSEDGILDRYEDWSKHDIRWIAVDPGVRSLLTTWCVGENTSPYTLGQPQYRHESGLTKYAKIAKKMYTHRKMEDVQKALTENPYAKCVSPELRLLHLQVIQKYWDRIWEYQSWKQIRRVKFSRFIKQQSFMDKTLHAIEKVCDVPGKQSIVLFGKGGRSGFGHVRGGGVKGPVVKIRRLLAKRVPVIHVDEYRTSKCCWECGKVLLHPLCGSVNAVSYCSETDHHRMLNRDVDAARKIGYRFLLRLQHGGDDSEAVLGAWSRQVKAGTLNRKKYFHLLNFAALNVPGNNTNVRNLKGLPKTLVR
jgi:transposase